MSRIISVSRRTDVPAFYGAWFMRRMAEGLAGWENPFGGQRYLVSLRREDVLAFVFWSKNYRPFLATLAEVRDAGYPILVNYTITGLPAEMECNLVPAEDALDSLATISDLLSPEHINWRYDPIVVSDTTPPAYHEARFAELCTRLRDRVRRCYISFAIRYGKVQRNYRQFEDAHGITIKDPPPVDRIALARRLAEIAAAAGIETFSCCGDYLVDGTIRKAHCIDGDILSRLYFGGRWQGIEKPTRKECGCTESADIGAYDTCPHGCIYCYANVNKQRAVQAWQRHDPASPFLGMSAAEAERCLAALRLEAAAGSREAGAQMTLDI